jgi:hypothetical protein
VLATVANRTYLAKEVSVSLSAVSLTVTLIFGIAFERSDSTILTRCRNLVPFDVVPELVDHPVGTAAIIRRVVDVKDRLFLKKDIQLQSLGPRLPTTLVTTIEYM